MEKNEIMVLGEMIYHLYDETDPLLRTEQLLSSLRHLLSCSYASVLRADRGTENGRPVFCDPICDPVSFLPAEEAYIRLSAEDPLLWSAEAGRPSIIRESRMLTDEKRLRTPLYQQCYRSFDVFDTLQTNLFEGTRFLGVLTLYRTRQEGHFDEEDVFIMQVLASHLVRFFARAETERTAEDVPDRARAGDSRASPRRGGGRGGFRCAVHCTRHAEEAYAAYLPQTGYSGEMGADPVSVNVPFKVYHDFTTGKERHHDKQTSVHRHPCSDRTGESFH